MIRIHQKQQQQQQEVERKLDIDSKEKISKGYFYSADSGNDAIIVKKDDLKI